MEHILLRIKNNDKCISIQEGLEYCETVARDYLNSEYENLPMEEMYKPEWIEGIIDRYKRAIVGWVKHWKVVHKEYEVIAVEQTLICPVIVPKTGKVYSPRNTFYIDTENNLYSKGYINNGDEVQIEMPYYKIGKADAIVRKRGTKSLYILDHKTTSQPNSYQKRFLFDMQLASYCALLNFELIEGELQHFKDHKIDGVIWDLCHSKIPSRPVPLKSGKLSTSKKSIPSWIYEQAIEHYELDRNDYIEHLEYLKESDGSYFQLLEVSISYKDMHRAYLEDYATAKSMHEQRVLLHDFNDTDFNYKAPRYPICEQYQHCKYSKYCLPNTEISKLDQTRIKKEKKIYWRLLTDKSECDNITNEDQLGLPF